MAFDDLVGSLWYNGNTNQPTNQPTNRFNQSNHGARFSPGRICFIGASSKIIDHLPIHGLA
jgi:hypothetical protein